MCGICGYIGYNEAFEHIIFGLTMLQNRGYDSAGICTLKNGKIAVTKYATTKNCISLEKIKEDASIFEDSTVGIGHTRWATHGPKTDENSHPHLDYKDRFAVVHNGIIENYAEIKKELVEKYGVKFRSQTDTEVVVNLLSINYEKTGSVDKAIHMTLQRIEGTWGLVIMCVDEPDKLYCVRHGSPILIGMGENFMMVASEPSGISKYVNNYICMDDSDIVVLEKNNGMVEMSVDKKYELREIVDDGSALTPFPYPHWTIKEINEQVESTLRAMGMGGRVKDSKHVKLGGLNDHTDDLLKINHLIILGCGTSYHSGLCSLSIFKRISGFDTVQIFDGAEFNRYDVPTSGKTGLLLLSQSGETKDLHRALELGKELGLYMVGIVNVVDSMIAREVHCGVYLNAGKEVGVASTKAFSSQVLVLHMIALWFAQNRGIHEIIRGDVINDLRQVSMQIKQTIQTCSKVSKDVAKYLAGYHSAFILGKGSYEAIAKEGSLKIKEIGYINCNGYSSSALKHGPYAIIEKNFPVIIINPNDENYTKNDNICEELKSRGAYVIGISDADLSSRYDVKIRLPKNDYFVGLLSTIVLQMVAYELACYKGYNPDMPKNLAKVVTTD